MRLVVNDDGARVFEDDGREPTAEQGLQRFPAYMDAVPRYVQALDPLFAKAREVSEFEFLMSLLRVRSMQDTGWDSYETTLRAVPALRDAGNSLKTFEASRHLSLMMYCHIFEAAEPYEILGNLIGVAKGGRFSTRVFPVTRSPGKKMAALTADASRAGVATLDVVFEAWDRDLRNAVSHSDYVLHGGELRILHPMKRYTNEEIHRLTNRALAFHDALSGVYRAAISSYTEPKRILVHPGFSNRRRTDEYAVVMVRDGHGAIGMKEGWAPEEISEEEDRITWRVGRFLASELNLMDRDPTLASFPKDPRENDEGGGAEVM